MDPSQGSRSSRGVFLCHALLLAAVTQLAGCGSTTRDAAEGDVADLDGGGESVDGGGESAEAAPRSDVSIALLTTNMPQMDGFYLFPATIPGGLAGLNLRLANHNLKPAVVDLSFEEKPAHSGWATIAPSPASLAGVIVPSAAAENPYVTTGFAFDRPAGNGLVLEFTVRVTEHGTQDVVDEISIRIATVEN